MSERSGELRGAMVAAPAADFASDSPNREEAMSVGERWRFQVYSPGAERVYLVREAQDGATAWIEMNHAGRGQWDTQVHLAPGRYRFRYFRSEGTTFLNCGNYGLTGQRLGDADPLVAVDEVEYAVPA